MFSEKYEIKSFRSESWKLIKKFSTLYFRENVWNNNYQFRCNITIFQALTLNIFIYLYISFLIVLYNIIADIYRISSEQNFINKIFTKNLKILKFKIVKINIDNNYSKLMQSLIWQKTMQLYENIIN